MGRVRRELRSLHSGHIYRELNAAITFLNWALAYFPVIVQHAFRGDASRHSNAARHTDETIHRPSMTRDSLLQKVPIVVRLAVTPVRHRRSAVADE